MKMQENEAVGLILDCAMRTLGMCILIAENMKLGRNTREFVDKQFAWLDGIERMVEVGTAVDEVMEGNDD